MTTTSFTLQEIFELAYKVMIKNGCNESNANALAKTLLNALHLGIIMNLIILSIHILGVIKLLKILKNFQNLIKLDMLKLIVIKFREILLQT